MKKLLFLTALLYSLGSTSCSMDETDKTFINEQIFYQGTLTVTPLAEGETYNWENTKIGLLEEPNGSLSIILYDTKFVPQMPAMTMTLPNITHVSAPALTSILGDNIVPHMGDTPYERYLVTKLSGTIIDRGLSLVFNCMGFHITFNGNEKNI